MIFNSLFSEGKHKNSTSTWKRTSANGLLKEDNKNGMSQRATNILSLDAPSRTNVDRSANILSAEVPQFSTFIRVTKSNDTQWQGMGYIINKF